MSGHSFTQLLLGNETSKTYEYVMVPNNGDVADYQGLDVTGKIAVVGHNAVIPAGDKVAAGVQVDASAQQ